jgi:hypothetical protein
LRRKKNQNRNLQHPGVEPRIGGAKCPPKMEPSANLYHESRFNFGIEPNQRMGKFREFITNHFLKWELFFTIFTYDFSDSFGPFLLKEWA